MDEALKSLSKVLRTPLTASTWSPPTTATCGLLFRMVARLAASLHQLIQGPRQAFPYKLFHCLKQGDLGASIHEILNSPACLHDEITRKYVAMFQAPDAGSEPLAQLTAIAEFAAVDIASIESRHASVRRALESSSVQTWRANLAKISAEFVIRQEARRRFSIHRRLYSLIRVKQKPGRKPKKRKKLIGKRKNHGGGGAHRAFMQEKLLEHGEQGKTNLSSLFRRLNNQYKALTPEQFSHYKAIGEAGTLAHKSGHKAFGEKRCLTSRKKAVETQQVAKKKWAPAEPAPEARLALPHSASSQLAKLHSSIRKSTESERRRRNVDAAKDAKALSDLRQFSRKGLGLSGDISDSDVADKRLFDEFLSQTMCPHVSSIPNCSSFQFFPPSAKQAKEIGCGGSHVKQLLLMNVSSVVSQTCFLMFSKRMKAFIGMTRSFIRITFRTWNHGERTVSNFTMNLTQEWFFSFIAVREHLRFLLGAPKCACAGVKGSNRFCSPCCLAVVVRCSFCFRRLSELGQEKSIVFRVVCLVRWSRKAAGSRYQVTHSRLWGCEGGFAGGRVLVAFVKWWSWCVHVRLSCGHDKCIFSLRPRGYTLYTPDNWSSVFHSSSMQSVTCFVRLHLEFDRDF